MNQGASRIPSPINEPVRAYAPGDSHRESLKKKLEAMAAEKIEIPLVIGGKEIRTGKLRKVVMPHDHGHVLAEFHLATEKEMALAVDAARKAKASWQALPWEERTAIFLKAADLLAGPWRDTLNAATMLGQSKNVYQAEIDAACELIDFLRFNAQFYQDILAMQPLSSGGVWNRTDWRPLEGFVFAVTPFNFTAIAANLPAAPAMLGNTVVWKPSDTQMLSAHYTMKLLEAAGIPAGVINFVPSDGPAAGEYYLGQRDLGGIHFTGSTATFNWLNQKVASNLGHYRAYPRIVGETGGKDFVFAHPSANADGLATALIRGAFEYQGQKCSAASRAYIPQSLWGQVKERMLSDLSSIKTGDVRDFSNFVNAVIDERSFNKISGYLDQASKSASVRVLAGGKGDGRKGYFIQPTVLETSDAKYRTMEEEIFGPVLTVYPYDDSRFEETLKICDETSPYALTGALFAQDRSALVLMADRLRHAAGNLYLNDKPTGAVVGQQPFGGARASGTNDKAGSALNLLRWLSPRSIKEPLVTPTDYRYPFLG